MCLSMDEISALSLKISKECLAVTRSSRVIKCRNIILFLLFRLDFRYGIGFVIPITKYLPKMADFCGFEKSLKRGHLGETRNILLLNNDYLLLRNNGFLGG